jgi:DNA polymerase III sliding clamp (beta) subunit (PCNA family)
MKYIKIVKSEIQSLIDDASRFAAKKGPDNGNDPLPSFLKLSLAKNLLTIEAHDAVNYVSQSLEIECDQEAVIFLPIKLLQQAITQTDDAEINIGVDDDHLVVKSSFGKTSLKVLPIEPEQFTEHTSTFPTDLTGSSFAHALGMVAFAAERRDDGSTLSGVRVEFVDDNEIILVATDAVRIAKYQISLNCEYINRLKKMGNFIISIKTVNNLIGVLSKEEGKIGIGLDEYHISFSWKGGYISSCRVNGSYPNWRDLFPTEPKTTVSFLEGFQNATRAAKIMAKGTVWNYPIITLEIKPEETLVKSESDLGKSTIALSPTFTGNDLNIVFNGNFLPDNVFGEVKIEMTAPLKPALFTSKSEPSWAYLLMPLLHERVKGK